MALIDATLYQHTGVINGSSPSAGTNPTFPATPIGPGDVYSALVNCPADASAVSFRINAIDGSTYVAADMNVNDLYVGVYFMFTSFPASNSEEWALSSDALGTTARVGFRINSAKQLQFHDNAALASNTATAVMSTVLVASTKYYAQIYLPTGTPSATGHLKLYSFGTDGNKTLLETLTCTGDYTSGQNLRLHFGRRVARNNLAYSCNFGRIAHDSAAHLPVNWSTYYAKATADGTYTNAVFTVTGAGSATAAVSEIPIDANTSYLNANAGVDGQCYSFTLQTATALGIPTSATVLGVHPCPNNYASGASTWKTRFRIASTDYDTGAYSTTTSQIHMRGPWYLTNPGGGSWAVSQLTNWEVGIMQTAGASGHTSNVAALIVTNGDSSAVLINNGSLNLLYM